MGKKSNYISKSSGRLSAPSSLGLKAFTGSRMRCPKKATPLTVRVPRLFNEIKRALGPS